MRSRNKLLWLAAILAALTSILIGQSASAITSSMSLGAGQTMTVNCSSGSSVSWKKTSIGQGNVSCSVPSTTTTLPTTTVPPTTTTVPAPTTTVPDSTTTVPQTTTTVPSGPSACPQFQTTSNSAAFCDPMATANPVTGTRAGDLNGTVWGVSRVTNLGNPPQGQLYDWASVNRDTCGQTQTVKPEHDIAICNGHMVEAVNDAGYQALLAAYPRQPFDFAGRTGTVQFDVTDNSQGIHAAWPSFVITDQPVPAPYGIEQNAGDAGDLSGVSDAARNSIGVDFDLVNGSCVTAQIWATSQYQRMNPTTHQDGCVQESSGPNGAFNHVEVQVNSSGVKVYMSDAGGTSARLVADSSFSVPLTRGLVWIEDVHYNAGKFNTQQTNTFAWQNVAFDGPVLARDLGFDIPDSMTSGGSAENGLPMFNVGYDIPSSPVVLTVPNVSGTANASGALLVMNYWPWNPQTLTYSVNGGASQSFAWPFGNQSTYTSQTVGLPLNLSDLHDGNNTIQIKTSDGNGVAAGNFDLILVGAGGVVSP